MKVALFGCIIFADVSKMRAHWIRISPLSSDWYPWEKKEVDEEREEVTSEGMQNLGS